MSHEPSVAQRLSRHRGWRLGTENCRPQARPALRRLSAAFTIVEAVISTIIVAVMFVAALNTVGASRLTQHRASLVSRGQLLAEALLAEILRQSYQEPADTPVFGREAGELATSRTNYDDVDDYHGWSATPPTAKDGTTLANSTGWQQTVTVEWVDPVVPTQTAATESGVKRITVTVAYNAVPQATLVALRANRQ